LSLSRATLIQPIIIIINNNNKIRREVTELERHNWKIEFNCIKAHAGHQGNEMANELAKEVATNSDIKECYFRIPKSAVKSELSENSETKCKQNGTAQHTV